MGKIFEVATAVSLDYLGGNIYHFFGGKIGYFGGSFKKRER